MRRTLAEQSLHAVVEQTCPTKRWQNSTGTWVELYLEYHVQVMDSCQREPRLRPQTAPVLYLWVHTRTCRSWTILVELKLLSPRPTCQSKIHVLVTRVGPFSSHVQVMDSWFRPRRMDTPGSDGSSNHYTRTRSRDPKFLRDQLPIYGS